jgi:hypothetical protein
MKTLVLTVSLAMAGIAPAQAQIFRSSVGGGAAVGAVAGSLIGGHNGDRWAQGAVIGAVAGALIGAAVAPQEQVYTPPPVYQSPPTSGYGQQVYGVPPSATVPDAATVPMAPSVGAQPPVQVVTAPPQVVYVEAAPRVVYVPAPRVVYAPPPVVSFGFGYYSGPRGYAYGHGHRR